MIGFLNSASAWSAAALVSPVSFCNARCICLVSVEIDNTSCSKSAVSPFLWMSDQPLLAWSFVVIVPHAVRSLGANLTGWNELQRSRIGSRRGRLKETQTVTTGAKWTDAEDQRLLALRAAGNPITVIAKEFPRTEAAVWGRWLLLRKRGKQLTTRNKHPRR